MDDRFPRFLRKLVRRLDFLALPNLGMFICAASVLAFIAQNFFGASYEQFMFDPHRVLNGEWWRLFSFPLSDGLDNPLWLIFYVLYVYFIMGLLESSWGSGPLTVYVLFSYLAALGGAFVIGQPVPIWFYILENVSLAFGSLFPELELYLYFILPVKAKWLALLAGALILFKFLVGSLLYKLFLLIVLSPYLIFFIPLLIRLLKERQRVASNRKRFDEGMWR